MEQIREETVNTKLLSDKMIEYLYDTQEGVREDYGEKYRRVRDQYLSQTQDLKNRLSEEQAVLYRKVEDLNIDMYAMEDIETFIRGFKLGIKFMLEFI